MLSLAKRVGSQVTGLVSLPERKGELGKLRGDPRGYVCPTTRIWPGFGSQKGFWIRSSGLVELDL